MQIRCPKCGEIGEVDEEPQIGQHLLCSYCAEKFSYLGGGKSEKLESPDLLHDINNQKTIECTCPHCGTMYEILERKLGEPAKCEACGETFILKKLLKGRLSEGLPTVLPGGLKLVVQKNTKSSAVTFAPKRRYCRECGAEVNERAVVCVKCGCAIDCGNRKSVRRSPKVKNHLIDAIVSVFFCFPLGIVAIIFAVQSQQKLSNGDYQGAVADSKVAGIIIKIVMILVVIGFVVGTYLAMVSE